VEEGYKLTIEVRLIGTIALYFKSVSWSIFCGRQRWGMYFASFCVKEEDGSICLPSLLPWIMDTRVSLFAGHVLPIPSTWVTRMFNATVTPQPPCNSTTRVIWLSQNSDHWSSSNYNRNGRGWCQGWRAPFSLLSC